MSSGSKSRYSTLNLHIRIQIDRLATVSCISVTPLAVACMSGTPPCLCMPSL